MKGVFRRVANGFVPAMPSAEQMLSRVPMGAEVMISVSRPRNPGQHRKFFVLLHLIFQNQEECQTETELRAKILVATGHCDTFPLNDGRIVAIPHSMSEESMPADDFEDFYEKAVEYIVNTIIPGLDKDLLEREVNDMIAFDPTKYGYTIR
ncbi:DUF1367 family protein [Patescibacteria group bacterium]|nr:DUF1367 family protein [Patescibacteria group bacterium]